MICPSEQGQNLFARGWTAFSNWQVGDLPDGQIIFAQSVERGAV
jgi:hypothetical protein